jgi:hypothetical protein
MLIRFVASWARAKKRRERAQGSGLKLRLFPRPRKGREPDGQELAFWSGITAFIEAPLL